MNHRFAIEDQQHAVTIADGPNLDAFSRLRISNPETTFEVQNQYSADALRMEGGASGAGVAPAHDANNRMVLMQVNAGGAGGVSFLQSYQYLPYQPGKSQYIAMTGVLGAGVADAVKRFGYGDLTNGIFYEQNGTGGLQFNRRTTTSGVTVDNTVPQANWNLDRLDGTGPSGVTLNPSASFILIIDLQYLGMGRVRVGFDVDGHIYYAHEFLNANVLAVPYMQTASLPIMAEIRAAVALGAPATAYFKCGQVASEGGYDVGLGRQFSVEQVVTAASGARTHVLSVRPKLTYNGLTNHGMFVPIGLDFLGGSNPVLWELVIGVAFTAAPAWSDVNTNYSFMEYTSTVGTFNNVTAGVVIDQGYIGTNTPNQRLAASNIIAMSYPITLNRAGAQRAMGTLSVLVTGIGGTSAMRASMNWSEIR